MAVLAFCFGWNKTVFKQLYFSFVQFYFNLRTS